MGRLAVIAATFSSACFSLTPPAGAPCANGMCPSGLTCVMATNTCERPGSTPFDASGDGDPAIDAATCYGTFAPICPVAPITMPLSITSSTTIDTDTSPMCIEHAAANELCVIAGTTVCCRGGSGAGAQVSTGGAGGGAGC